MIPALFHALAKKHPLSRSHPSPFPLRKPDNDDPSKAKTLELDGSRDARAPCFWLPPHFRAINNYFNVFAIL